MITTYHSAALDSKHETLGEGKEVACLRAIPDHQQPALMKLSGTQKGDQASWSLPCEIGIRTVHRPEWQIQDLFMGMDKGFGVRGPLGKITHFSIKLPLWRQKEPILSQKGQKWSLARARGVPRIFVRWSQTFSEPKVNHSKKGNVTGFHPMFF